MSNAGILLLQVGLELFECADPATELEFPIGIDVANHWYVLSDEQKSQHKRKQGTKGWLPPFQQSC